MKKLIETLKNCWRIEDLRQRLLITLLFTAIYRFGSFVVLPGINPGMLEKLQQQTSHLGVYRDAAACHCCALFPKDAARR